MAFQRHDLPDTRDDDGGQLLSETLVAPSDELEAAAQSRAVDQRRHQVRSMSPRKLDEITYAFARTFKRSAVRAWSSSPGPHSSVVLASPPTGSGSTPHLP